MNYEQIKKDLISEIKLSENQADVFLLVVMKGKMSASRIADLSGITINEAKETSQKLVALGGFIDMPKTEY